MADFNWEMNEADQMRGIVEIEPHEVTEEDAKRMADRMNELDEIQEDTTSMEEKLEALQSLKS